MLSSDDAPAEVAAAINRAWTVGRLEDLVQLLHPRAVIVAPDLTRLAEGRDACIASYRDFLSSGTVHAFEDRDFRAEQYHETAVVSYTYRIDYSSRGERHDEEGREVLVLRRGDTGWLLVWRQILPGALSAPASRPELP